MDALLVGATFGAALTASGVSQPSIITSQLKFTNFHMFEAFLTATATSAVIATVAQRVGYAHPRPRQAQTIGWFSRFDGNIVGGALLGAGMALSGACPGTVLSQMAIGIKTGYYALVGALGAGIVWSGVLKPRLAQNISTKNASNGSVKVGGRGTEVHTVTAQEALGVSQLAVLVGFETMCAAAVGAMVVLTGQRDPVFGGLLIGAAQLFSILTRRAMVSVSGSYQDAGDWFWFWLAGHRPPKGRNTPETSAILFSLGILVGSRAFISAFPSFVSTEVPLPPWGAVLGGFTMLLGSRIAGGCTSGHGISGVSIFALSSFVTIASAFGAGAAVARVLPY